MAGFVKSFRMVQVFLFGPEQPLLGELENMGRKLIWIEQTNNNNQMVILQMYTPLALTP